MSSARVRVTNKLLSKLGAVKSSKNVQFDMAHESFVKTHSNIQNLQSALGSFLSSMQSFHTSGLVLIGAIENFTADKEDTSEELKQLVQHVKNGFNAIDSQLASSWCQSYEQKVLKPATGWTKQADTLRGQVMAFNDQKEIYDHYSRKVMALRESHTKRMGANTGRFDRHGDIDKLSRNEQKLAAATTAYAKVSEGTINGLRQFVSTRENTLIPIVHRLIDFRTSYTATMSHEVSALLGGVAQSDTLEDTAVAHLDRFMKDLGMPSDGVPASPSKSNTSAHSSPTNSPKHAVSRPEELYDPSSDSPVQVGRYNSFVDSNRSPAKVDQTLNVPTSPSSPQKPFDPFEDSYQWEERSTSASYNTSQPPPPPPPSTHPFQHFAANMMNQRSPLDDLDSINRSGNYIGPSQAQPQGSFDPFQ